MAKVMVSLPDDLLAQIDRTAKQRGTTRSGLLADAARHELSGRDAELVRAAIERSEARFADAPPFDAADLVRLDRDERDVRDRNRGLPC